MGKPSDAERRNRAHALSSSRRGTSNVPAAFTATFSAARSFSPASRRSSRSRTAGSSSTSAGGPTDDKPSVTLEPPRDRRADAGLPAGAPHRFTGPHSLTRQRKENEMLLATTQVGTSTASWRSSRVLQRRSARSTAEGSGRLPRPVRERPGLGDLRLGRAGLAELRVRPGRSPDPGGRRGEREPAGRGTRRQLRTPEDALLATAARLKALRVTHVLGPGRRRARVGSRVTRRSSSPARVPFGTCRSRLPRSSRPEVLFGRAVYRTALNAARISSVKSCGCSQAAKWPPLSTSLK